jgi:hypothetical protein
MMQYLRCQAFGVLAIALALRGTGAQAAADLDFTILSRFVQRGYVESSSWVLSPRAWVGASGTKGEFSLGTSALNELRWGGPSALVLKGASSRWTSNVNSWAEGRIYVLQHEVVLGYDRNDYTVASPLSLPYDDRNEVYAKIESSHDQPIVSGTIYSLAYWHGIAGSETRFAQLSVGRQTLLLPLNDFTGSADLKLGADFSKGARLESSQRLAVVELRLGLSQTRRCDQPFKLLDLFPEIGFHSQWGLQKSVQRVTTTTYKPAFSWWEFNFWPRACSAYQ